MHWTYDKSNKEDDLCQGDILEPSQELLACLKEEHPSFSIEECSGFLVITQECDLVRRKNIPYKATHINLSVIRTLQSVIEGSLKNAFGCLGPGIYNQGMKKSVEMLAERLINQNENSLGLFYLHPCADSGVYEDSVALLRFSFSVNADRFYDALLKAREGKLNQEFRAKLGWMVGYLFSRVGVKDWEEEKSKEIINNILSFMQDKPVWLNKKVYKNIIEEHPEFNDYDPEKQLIIIKEFLPKSPKEKVLDHIVQTAKAVYPRIDNESLSKIRTRLINNESFNAQMKKVS